eukprot:COSAG06_NODE_561_length_14287_cov_13.422047_10_plen_572_part_00
MEAEWQRAVAEERAEDSARGVVAWMVADVAPAGYQEQRSMKGLHSSRLNTLWVNAAGLAGAVGTPQSQRLVLKNPMVLAAPPATTRGAMEALVDFFGRETAMDVIWRSPSVLMAPRIAETVQVLRGAFSEKDVQEMVARNPAVLKAPVATVKSALAALMEFYGGDDAAVLAMVLQSPGVLMARGIAGTLEVLRGAFSEKDVRAMVARNPAVLKARVATVESALAALMEFYGGDDAAVLAMVLQSPGVLMAPRIAGTLEVLRGAFSEKDVRAMVEQSPAVLTAPVATVESALAALMEFYGGDDAAVLATVLQSPGVLKAPRIAGTLQMEALVDFFGRETAMDVIWRSPSVLMSRGIAGTLEVLRGAFSEKDVQEMVARNPAVLKARVATVESALAALMEFYGGDDAAVLAMVLQSPGVLMARGIAGTLEVLRGAFSEKDVRTMVEQSPAMLKAPVATVESALAALMEFYGGDDAAVLATVLQSPGVLMAPRIAGTLEVLRDAKEFAEEDVRAMVARNPAVLRTPAATIKRHLKTLRAGLTDAAAVRDAVSRDPEVLRAKPRLDRALQRRPIP